MKSVEYKKAEKEAEVLMNGAPLEAFNYSVHVITEEGGSFWFQNSFLTVLSNGWYAVCPEHAPVHVWDEDDLYGIQMYTPVPPLKKL